MTQQVFAIMVAVVLLLPDLQSRGSTAFCAQNESSVVANVQEKRYSFLNSLLVKAAGNSMSPRELQKKIAYIDMLALRGDIEQERAIRLFVASTNEAKKQNLPPELAIEVYSVSLAFDVAMSEQDSGLAAEAERSQKYNKLRSFVSSILKSKEDPKKAKELQTSFIILALKYKYDEQMVVDLINRCKMEFTDPGADPGALLSAASMAMVIRHFQEEDYKLMMKDLFNDPDYGQMNKEVFSETWLSAAPEDLIAELKYLNETARSCKVEQAGAGRLFRVFLSRAREKDVMTLSAVRATSEAILKFRDERKK